MQIALRQKPARAFVIESASDLFAGPAADGRVGDFELENGVVAFVIGRADQALGFADSGGHIIDAGPVGGQDAIKQMFELTGPQFPRQAIYERVETDMRGNAALVRASGRDSSDRTLEVTTEYILQPGARALQIETTWTNRGLEILRELPVGEAIQWGLSERFIPEQGFAAEAAAPREVTTPQGWMLGIGSGVTYGYVVAGPLKAKHGAGWSDVALGELTIAPGATQKFSRWLVISAAPDLALGEAISSLRGERWAKIAGRVIEDGSGAPVPGVRLSFADRNGRAIAITQSSDSGYSQLAPPGDYLVGAEAPGRRGPQHLEVKLGAGSATTLDVLLSKPGSLAYRIEESSKPSPAKLTFLGIAPTRTPTLGSAAANPGSNIALSASGSGTVALPPGRYRVIASRGPAFSLDDKEVEITSGAPTEAKFKLTRAVDLQGIACADLHQHAAPSADSGVSPDDRVAANLAEGLDLIVTTDHNIVGDYGPSVARLQSSARLAWIPGEEATREGVGHFNVWPMPLRSDDPRGGALDVRGKNAHQILGELRTSDRVVAVDHPRASIIGYFNLVGFDPLSLVLPAAFEAGFDALEVFTGKDSSKTDEPLADWMALTNRGLIYTAIGGSDSHLIWGQEVGYPRTCVPVDGPPTAEALVQAIKSRREALVTNGPFISVSVGGKGMGQLAPAPRGKARLDVEVRAAPWVDTRRLEIWVNGQRRGKPIDLPVSRAPLRFKGSIELKIDHDSTVIVIVRGSDALEPVVSRPEGGSVPTPFAVTNRCSEAAVPTRMPVKRSTAINFLQTVVCSGKFD
jgi:hypothetical protein